MNESASLAPRKAANTRAWLSVARAYNLCDAALATRLSAIGLRVSEHEVLAHMFYAPGLTQQALAERCFVAKSGVSMLLTRMEADGLLTRESDAKDGRTKRLCLSDSGEALARCCLKIQEDVVSHMMGSLSDSEVLAMTELSERVCAQLQPLVVR